MHFLTKKDVIIPKRKSDSHKGDFGRALIIGGSVRYVGAPSLAGLAALRSGCDLVNIAAPEKVAWAINKLSPDLITIKLSGKKLSLKHYNQLVKEANKADAVLIGSGASLDSAPKKLMKKLCEKLSYKKVIDADALKSIDLRKVSNSILTPHRGELKILLRNSKLKNVAQAQKILSNNILVIKGQIDQIIINDKIFYNKTGNPGMTKGGTGDVLAGLALGYLCQGQSLLQSAINAVYINGLAGDILMKKKKGFTYLASDLAEEIGRLKI